MISTRSSYIGTYYTKFKLNVTLPRPFIKRDIVFKRYITVLAKAYLAILIEYNKLPTGNYIFKLVNGYLIALFTTLVDLSFYIILVRNNLD